MHELGTEALTKIVKHGTVNIFGQLLDALYMHIHGIGNLPLMGRPSGSDAIAP